MASARPREQGAVRRADARVCWRTSAEVHGTGGLRAGVDRRIALLDACIRRALVGRLVTRGMLSAHPPSTARGDGLLAIQVGTACRSMSGSHLTYPRLLEPEGHLRLRSYGPTRTIGPHGRQVALSRGVWQRPRAGGRGGDGRAGLALLNRWTSCLCVRTRGSAHARVAAGPSGLPSTA